MGEAEFDQVLDALIAVTNKIAGGDYRNVDALLDMTGAESLPPKIQALAESFGMMLVQVEAREFRLSMTIDTLERTQEELEKANYDALTDLPNRVIFYDRLRKAVTAAKAAGRFMAVMFIDLDRFKWVNDNLGHGAGDELLCQVAKRLKQCVRDDDLIARMGGDEFTVILPKVTGLEDAADIAGRMVAILREPFDLDGQDAQIGCSIGIARCPRHGDTPEQLLKGADTAMYKAKEAGRNNFQTAE